MGQELRNTSEAARFLRVSEASIRRWSDAGLLTSHRVGRRRDVPDQQHVRDGKQHIDENRHPEAVSSSAPS